MTDVPRRPPAVLLGAGASIPADLPAARDLTRRAMEATVREPHARVLHFVVTALRLHDVRTGNQDYLEDDPGIERLVSAVELLASRADLEVTPFVRDWDPMVDELERDPSPPFLGERNSKQLIEKIIQASVAGATGRSGGSSYRNLDRQLIALIKEATTVGRKPVFAQLHDQLVERLGTDLRLDSEASTSYLNPLLAYMASTGGSIATLNYDLTVETAAGAAGYQLNRLVDSWSETGRLARNGAGIPYMKLHGSVDWELTGDGDELILTGDERRHAWNNSPALVYGQREKLRSRGPFLELLEEFRHHLADADLLIVAGYSFGDEHINTMIRRWLRVNRSANLVLVDPGVPDLLAHQWRGEEERAKLWWNYGAGASTQVQEEDRRLTRRAKPRKMYLRRQGIKELGEALASGEKLQSDVGLTPREHDRSERLGYDVE